MPHPQDAGAGTMPLTFHTDHGAQHACQGGEGPSSQEVGSKGEGGPPRLCVTMPSLREMGSERPWSSWLYAIGVPTCISLM